MSIPGADPAVVGLILFGLCILGFLSNIVPMAQIAITGCALMVILGVANFATIFGPFASSSVALVICMMIVGEAMSQTGLIQHITNAISRLTHENERLYLLVLCALAAAVSAFVSNVATMALFIPMAQEYCRLRGRDSRRLLLPLAMACQIGGGVTLMGSAPQIVALGMAESLVGDGFGFFEFGRIGGVLVVLLLAYIFFVGYPRSNRIWGDSRMEGDLPAGAKKDAPREKKLPLMTAIFLVTCVMFYFEPIPLPMVAMSAALVCVFTGCVDRKKAVGAVSWSVVGKLGGCLGLVAGLKASGGLAMMSDAVDRVLPQTIAPFWILAILCAVTMLLSEFLANSTALMITLPPALALCAARGMNPLTFLMALTWACNALGTPLSATVLMMIMGDRYKFSDFLRYALPYDLLLLCTTVALAPLLYPL